MKLKNICLGIACIAVVSACNDKMDYHEYTSYDKDYVFSDFSRTAGFVNNIYSYGFRLAKLSVIGFRL